MQSWGQVTLWLSAGLYGYLIVHHVLQAYLAKERLANLLLLLFAISSLVVSIADAQLYQPVPQPPKAAFVYSAVQFVASVFCSVLFVQALNQLLRLRLNRWIWWLWLVALPSPALVAAGLLLTPDLEVRHLFTGEYYFRANSTPLGTVYSVVYLGAFLGALGLALSRWRRYSARERVLVSVLLLSIPLVVIDILAYYGLINFVPLWSFTTGVLALGISFHLNLHAHYLTRELERANQELQHVYRQLLNQERASVIGQVVRGIVHDLKNFFNNVQLLSDVGILRAHKDPQFDPIKYFASIRDATHKAHQYLTDLLSLTHDELELKPSEVSPAEIVREVERLVGAHLLNPPVQLVNNIPPTLRMHADRRYLVQLFLNLTLNAIQAMQHWQGERRIEYEWKEHPEQTILVVRDTGPGLPLAVREHLFEQSITTRVGGSGLGLMLVRDAVEKHGGWLQVVSEEGAGTMFVCVFPTPPLVESRAVAAAVTTT
ncbi:MAG: HAMP domain-containing sensor histidine kinase [Armatimonadota bacterium]|nr:HAMP domain-containing sensor histidine kinase [Armatimonadota bacterium]